MVVPDWISEGLRFIAGVITALTTVWVSRIVKGGTLAETLRQEQADIRKYLQTELAKLRAEHEDCSKSLNKMESILDNVRSLLRLAVARRTGGLPYDAEMAAALARLEQSDVPE